MKTATIYTVIDRTHIGRSIMPGSGLVSLDGAPANSDMKICTAGLETTFAGPETRSGTQPSHSHAP